MFAKLRTLLVLLIACLCLTGCIQYDVGINYVDQVHGEIVQRIKVGEQLTSFSNSTAQTWLQSVEQRTRQLGGRVRKLSKQEMLVTIPFNNGKDLAARFNQFFHPNGEPTEQPLQPGNLPNLDSNLQVKESNLLLLQRNRIQLDLDLRPLGVLSSEGNVLVSPGSLLDLEFSLNTPWGARSVGKESPQPEVRQRGKQLVWTLKAGEKNHLEAVFWVPSPLGIGTVAIALIAALGAYLRSQLARRTPAGVLGTNE